MITPTDLADKARELHAHPTIGSLFVARELADLVLAYEQQCERQVAEAVAEAKRRYPDKWAEYDEAEEPPWEWGIRTVSAKYDIDRIRSWGSDEIGARHRMGLIGTKSGSVFSLVRRPWHSTDESAWSAVQDDAVIA